MSVPVLLITGYLGAGKTTLINRLLSDPHGRRIAAVVNDFGEINIDAALLSSVSDGVINLKNGCICCSLLGDLLHTLVTMRRRKPTPEAIVIETSGVSNPAEIVRSLIDPAIWRDMALETVICVVDSHMVTDQPYLLDDPLWQSQVAAADFIALSKRDLICDTDYDVLRAKLHRQKANRAIHDMVDGALPHELLFSTDIKSSRTAPNLAADLTKSAFQTMTWTSPTPLVLSRFQAAVQQLAGRVLRAKGFVRFAERPYDLMLFQLVGDRATISRAPAGLEDAAGTQVVFIVERGCLDVVALTTALRQCCTDMGT